MNTWFASTSTQAYGAEVSRLANESEIMPLEYFLVDQFVGVGGRFVIER